MQSKKTRLSVIIPLFNSGKTIGPLADRVIGELSPQLDAIELVLVNDGSPDDTDMVVRDLLKKHKNLIRYIRLSRNFGEHNAVMCGLNHASGDYVAIIDDDFQNPPSEIMKLMEKIQEGFSVVYSYYDKKKHSWFRNFGSRFNNRVATWLLKKPKDLYLSSFKIMSADLVKKIIQYKGPFPYIDGLILQSTENIGTRLCIHQKSERGRSNYSLTKLIKLWLNVFTGFSIAPLRIASFIGLLMSGFAVLLMVFFLISYLSGGLLFKQAIPPGWASLILVVTFFGGVQLILLGIIGEYLGRLFLTANRSPQYIVDDVSGIEEKKKGTGNEE